MKVGIHLFLRSSQLIELIQLVRHAHVILLVLLLQIQARALLLGNILLIVMSDLWAQSAADNQFLEVVRQAAYLHPQSQSAAKSLEAAHQEQITAEWQRVASPSFQRISPQGNNVAGQINRFALEQPVYAGGRILAGIDAASHRYNSSYQQYQFIAQETAIKIINSWYEWQRQKERAIVIQEGVLAHQQLRQQIERRAQEGVSPEIDQALASARQSQMQSELTQTQSAASAAHALLMQLMGDQLLAIDAAASAISTANMPLPTADWIMLSVARDPQLAKLNADQYAAMADIQVKKAQLLPVVSFVFERNFNSQLLAPDQRMWLQVSVQPGAGLSSLSNVRAATARQESAAESRLSAERELKQNMTTDLASYIAASEQMKVGHMLRSSTQEVADSYARQFVTGRKSWLEVLNVVREAIQARLSVVDARALKAQTAWRLQIRSFGLEPIAGNAL